MIDEFILQSEASINLLSEDELKSLKSSIESFFNVKYPNAKINSKNVFSFLWQQNPISLENGIFQFCKNYGLYSSDKHDFHKFLRNLDPLNLSLEDIDYINISEYNVQEAIKRNVIISLKHVKKQKKETIEILIKKDIFNAFFVNKEFCNEDILKTTLSELFNRQLSIGTEHTELEKSLLDILTSFKSKGFDFHNFSYSLNDKKLLKQIEHILNESEFINIFK